MVLGVMSILSEPGVTSAALTVQYTMFLGASVAEER